MKTNVFFTIVLTIISAFVIFGNASQLSSDKLTNKKHRRKEVDPTTFNNSKQNIFLRVKSPMRNITATSRDTIQFKCKIEGWPKKIQFTWYKDDLIIDMSQDPRVSIVTRSWGSRLRIKDVFTVDTGSYRCEGSNGFRRVYSVASLKVEFELPPPLSKPEEDNLIFPAGKCERYSGLICKDSLSGLDVYVDSFETQEDIENQLQTALKKFVHASVINQSCQKYILPAFCHFSYTPCYTTTPGTTEQGQRLCREDCEFLQYNVCTDIFRNRKRSNALEKLLKSANCSNLPSQESSTCVKLGLTHPDLKKDEDSCYHKNGEEYQGRVNVASSGKFCQSWPLHMAEKHPELLGGHNFCRNPGGVEDQPWCYDDFFTSKKIACSIKKCDSENYFTLHNIVVVSCSGAGGFLIVFFFTLLCCLRPRRSKKLRKAPKFEKPMEASRSDAVLSRDQHIVNPGFYSQHPTPAFIDPSSIQLLTEIGSGKFGKVFDGSIINDSRFFEKQRFAFKIFNGCDATKKIGLCNYEIEVLSKLNHHNITNLKGVSLAVDKANILVFEHTNLQDLHEYLLLQSQHPGVSNSFQISSDSEKTFYFNFSTLARMSIQIASGMEYLSSNNYIHRDLAARNVLVCGNMDLKISNLGVVKNSYLSCYYKSPQGNLLPLRWMAPESLNSWQFSDKSTVWSFGVLLWEMFSYGMHPYCGYSNHEVLKMISRRQLLPCPDQCPAKIYSLMLECWNGQPLQRPDFKIIQNALKAALDNDSTDDVQENTFLKEKTFFSSDQYGIRLQNTDWQACPKYSEKISLISEDAPQTFLGE